MITGFLIATTFSRRWWDNYKGHRQAAAALPDMDINLSVDRFVSFHQFAVNLVLLFAFFHLCKHKVLQEFSFAKLHDLRVEVIHLLPSVLSFIGYPFALIFFLIIIYILRSFHHTRPFPY